MKTMPLEDRKNIVENRVASYDRKMQSIGDIFDTTRQFFEGFQDSFLDVLDTKREREKTSTELRENLAKNGSLRKKDFDRMMQGILSTQEEMEREARSSLKTYLNEQKEMTQSLRENLDKVRDALAKGDVQRVKEFQVLIKDILAKQEERKEEVTSNLKEFQKEQQEMTEKLLQLLAKGRELRIKDLKLMLGGFAVQHQERLAQREERKKEVIGRKEEVK